MNPERPFKLWAENPGDPGLQPADPNIFSAEFLNNFFSPGGEGARILAEMMPRCTECGELSGIHQTTCPNFIDPTTTPIPEPGFR